MKAMAKMAILATLKTIAVTRKHSLFEIFGMDFMIDDVFQPWLIEINTNPCLDTSSPVLQRIIPNLIEDTFKLCLDPLYPPPAIWPASRKYEIDGCSTNRLELIFDECELTNSARR